MLIKFNRFKCYHSPLYNHRFRLFFWDSSSSK
uniref:Uncharacterized protein n=1 Tax=Siphoviridae sp. ctmqu18 TaxID=2825655 RepID=A0A8S5V6I3_9CAUD|nr:MAG TPA: hypothetical protein [Siphoviridae sp. ctmqu18]